MTMRMQELAERSGLPKTTIHHYAREGLLPPAEKTAPNAARYGQSHLERLRLITRLRDDGDSRSLSIPEIRGVLEHLDAGADLRVAVRLVQAGVAADPASDGSWSTAAELAHAAGLQAEFIETLVVADLVGRGRKDGAFTSADLLVARACHAVCAIRGIDPTDLSPLGDLLREVGNYSATLVEFHTARATEPSGDPAPIEARRTLEADLAALCDVLLWRVMQA